MQINKGTKYHSYDPAETLVGKELINSTDKNLRSAFIPSSSEMYDNVIDQVILYWPCNKS